MLRTKFRCSQCCRIHTWASSRVFGAHYLVNQKVVILASQTHFWPVFFVHVGALTCASILPSQYINFCEFAGLGLWGTCTWGDKVAQECICCIIWNVLLVTVYHRNHYIERVASCAEASIQCAVEVKCGPEYSIEGEVWVMLLVSIHTIWGTKFNACRSFCYTV